MTAVPPFDAPGDQVSPIIVLEVTAELLASETGASGTTTMTAPLPSLV